MRPSMETQAIINFVLLSAVGVGGWFAREVWGAVKELRSDLHTIESNLPKEYVLKTDMDKRMDNDVVYEVTRVIWETPAEEWTNWHPTGAHMNEAFKPAMPSLSLYQPHPGAKKFYDEHGIKLKDLAELLR